MKDKIVFWGQDEKENDILVALRLRANDNKVDIWTFQKDKHPETFVDKMFQNWDDINPDEFEEPYLHIERDMSQPTLLPDEIRTKSTEIVARAETEWVFKVLSMKFAAELDAEIDALHTMINNLKEYDHEVWVNTQAFWEKISDKFRGRDINKEQSIALREKLNGCFSRLKDLRKAERFEEELQKNADKLTKQLDEQITYIKKGDVNLGDIFDALKTIQDEAKEARLSREARAMVRDKTNEAFELLREERKNIRNRRQDFRIKQLQETIEKLKVSIQRDHQDLEYQQNRNKMGSQLEVQLRDAKLNMLSKAIVSKEARLADMQRSLDELLQPANSSTTEQAPLASSPSDMTEELPNENA